MADNRVAHGWGWVGVGSAVALTIFIFQLTEDQGKKPRHFAWSWPVIGLALAGVGVGVWLLLNLGPKLDEAIYQWKLRDPRIRAQLEAQVESRFGQPPDPDPIIEGLRDIVEAGEVAMSTFRKSEQDLRLYESRDDPPPEGHSYAVWHARGAAALITWQDTMPATVEELLGATAIGEMTEYRQTAPVKYVPFTISTDYHALWAECDYRLDWLKRERTLRESATEYF